MIPTRDSEGFWNGWLLPLWHIDDEEPIEQVYLTVVFPGMSKGPHLHLKRRGRFTCVRGNVLIVTHQDDFYFEHQSGEDYEFAVVRVPAGVPAAIYNPGTEPAYVLNMPYPAWREDDQDEHPVEEWSYVRV